MNATSDALLIGCADYEDRNFDPLPASRQDVDELKRVLNDRSISDFAVSTLFNERSGVVSQEIKTFFDNRKPDDLLMLYFSCHGVLDSGNLYFVATNTRKRLLDSTAISAQWVKRQMDRSRSQRIVLLLDCCHSGGFPKGLARRSASAEEILEQLGGRGRVVITASDTMEYAYESRFTNAVIHGLETGAADRDGDGHISVYELYDYVYDRVRRQGEQQGGPKQTPKIKADSVLGQLYLAKNPHTPEPLPAELDDLVHSEAPWKRLWAVDGLRHLLRASDQLGGQKRKVGEALVTLRDKDPDGDVRQAAAEALRSVSHSVVSDPSHSPWRRYRQLAGAGLVVVVLMILGGLIYVSFNGPDGTPGGPDVAAGEAPQVPGSGGPGAECSRPHTRNANGVLTIGTLLPKGGTFTYAGPALEAGVDLAMKDITASDNIRGFSVVLDAANRRDEGTPSTDIARRSVDSLLGNGVDAIIGPATSPVTYQVIDRITCAGVIMVAPSNTSPVFTDYPDPHSLYFRTVPLSDLEGIVLGDLVVDDNNSATVLISRDDVYGNPLREAVDKKIRDRGGQVVDSFTYDPNSPDLDSIVQKIAAKDPDAIVLIGFSESAQIISRMIEHGLGPGSKNVYVPAATMTNTLVGQVGPENRARLTGLRGTTLDTGGQEFEKRLTELQPGLQDMVYAAQAYDAVVITALAAAAAGTDQPDAVANQINGVTRAGEKCTSFADCLVLVNQGRNIDYDGPSGPLDFADPGETRVGTYVISEIRPDGTITSLKARTVGP